MFTVRRLRARGVGGQAEEAPSAEASQGIKRHGLWVGTGKVCFEGILYRSFALPPEGTYTGSLVLLRMPFRRGFSALLAFRSYSNAGSTIRVLTCRVHCSVCSHCRRWNRVRYFAALQPPLRYLRFMWANRPYTWQRNQTPQNRRKRKGQKEAQNLMTRGAQLTGT